MLKTEKGNIYFSLDDFKDVCGKCQRSYYGDWQAVDCSYCKLPVIIDAYLALVKMNEEQDKLIEFYSAIGGMDDGR